MDENPYWTILSSLRKEIAERNTPAWRMGLVKSTSPLSVECGGLLLSGKELLLDPRLLPKEKPDGTELKTGERVAMLVSPDGSEFVIICKVVNG